MIWLIGGSLLMGLAYSWLIRWIYLQWWKIDSWVLPADYRATKRITILVAARNEAECIKRCLLSALNQSYPKDLTQIMVVDDFSEDGTIDIAQGMGQDRIVGVSLSDHLHGYTGPAFKKKALATGISLSIGDIILTMDADCQAPEHWAMTMVSYLESHSLAYATGPVILKDTHSGIEKFQALENIGMNIITGAGVHTGKMLLSFGANSAFVKSVFEEIGGYQHGDELASGDDIFLLQNIISQNAGSIGFCKSDHAVIATQAEKNFKDLFQQRIRWAAKYNLLKGSFIKPVMAFVFAYCFLIIFTPLLTAIFGIYTLFAWIVLVVFKLKTDYWFLRNASKEFNQKELIKSFWLSFVLYPIMVVTVALRSSVIKKYFWKGRYVR